MSCEKTKRGSTKEDLCRITKGVAEIETNPQVKQIAEKLRQRLDCCIDLRTTAGKRRVAQDILDMEKVGKQQGECKTCDVAGVTMSDLMDKWSPSLNKLRKNKKLV